MHNPKVSNHLKNPSVPKFLQPEVLFIAGLRSTNIDSKSRTRIKTVNAGDSLDSLSYFGEGPGDKRVETPQEQESKMAISRESTESPLNCSAPRTESPPKFKSVFRKSCDGSAESDQLGLSISSLLNGSYSTSYAAIYVIPERGGGGGGERPRTQVHIPTWGNLADFEHRCWPRDWEVLTMSLYRLYSGAPQ